MAEPSIAAQVVALTKLSVPELREKWKELFGKETDQRHRQYLIRRIAWELQRRYFGHELSPEAQQRLYELQAEFRENPPETWFKGAKHNRTPKTSPPKRPAPVRDPASPKPGTVLARDYKGHRITVRVIDGGFEWRGEIYRSLSAVAKAVTGSHCSGVAFFGLAKKGGGK
jgi:hypothetical protein